MTQTLHPRYYKLKAKRQLEIAHKKMRVVLKHTASEYLLAIELTNKVNIHFHIEISFKTETHKNVCIDSLRKIGFTDCRLLKTSEDSERWQQYMYKDMRKTRDFLGQPVLYSYKLDNNKLLDELKIYNELSLRLKGLLPLEDNTDAEEKYRQQKIIDRLEEEISQEEELFATECTEDQQNGV